MATPIRFLLNDEEISLNQVAPDATLLDYLRLQKRLTGSKEGCGEGDCGACSVLVGRLCDGELVYESMNACIRFVASLNATHVVTVEHVRAKSGALHPVQQAMVDQHGSQCGFCTPGFIMSLYALWLAKPAPSRAEIEVALQGNLCRCTGYEPIVKATEQAAKTLASAGIDPLLAERHSILARLQAMVAQDTIEMEHNGQKLIIPHSVTALASALHQNEGATLVAGSTDVGLWITKQMRHLPVMIFINHLQDLQEITQEENKLRLGAGVSYQRAYAVLQHALPGLAALIPRIGGQQVRNMGTIGGNIANGSPIGDMPPALIALGATVTLRSTEASRTLALEDFFIAYGKQDRKAGEFVESITIPLPPKDSHFAVYKISKRRDEDISALCGGFYLELTAQNRVQTIRLAFGGMAGTPKRALALEAALKGKPWTMETVQSTQKTLAEDFTPLSDWRASAAYRLLAGQNLLTRFYLETMGKTQHLERFNLSVEA